MSLRIAWLRAYSASVVERAISICSFEFHWMGHPPRVITYLVQDLMHTGVLVALIVPESSKVGIYVTVKLEIMIWLERKSVIIDSLQVATDVFHTFFVACIRAVSEMSTLVNSKLDLGVGV